MSARTSRASELDPRCFISLVETLVEDGRIKDEVSIRRMISALYFCLFNYWCAKKYESGIRKGGPLKDLFPYRDFHEELLKKKLDKEIVLLYTLRTASDHYVLNPTIIIIYDKVISRIIPKLRITMSLKALKNAISASKEILKHI